MSRNLITELFSAVDTCDWRKLATLFHPEVVYERPGYEQFKGVDRLLHFYRCERVLANGSHLIDRVVIDGSNGACWGRFVGTKKDGSAVDELFVDVYTFEGERIIRRRSYFFRPAI